jgi:3-methyladenine DNA glycosylase AlkD
MTPDRISAMLRGHASEEYAANLKWFFKTGPGEYGEGDRFLGVRVPDIRSVVREVWRTASFDDVLTLLESPWHEERLCALLTWVEQFRRGGVEARRRIYEAYMRNVSRINNWDLVDLSAGHIAGGWLFDRSRRPLERLAGSPLLWRRRVAIVATGHFIARGDFKPTLLISTRLLRDREDLIHKAVGWMLREVGKRDRPVLESFLDKHASNMPRTMLRYAIERFPARLRKRYMEMGRKPKPRQVTRRS